MALILLIAVQGLYAAFFLWDVVNDLMNAPLAPSDIPARKEAS